MEYGQLQEQEIDIGQHITPARRTSTIVLRFLRDSGIRD